MKCGFKLECLATGHVPQPVVESGPLSPQATLRRFQVPRYVAEFYKKRIAHLNHHDGQIDNSTGRIYRVADAKAKTLSPFDQF